VATNTIATPFSKPEVFLHGLWMAILYPPGYIIGHIFSLENSIFIKKSYTSNDGFVFYNFLLTSYKCFIRNWSLSP
jgi:hypothetical protein